MLDVRCTMLDVRCTMLDVRCTMAVMLGISAYFYFYKYADIPSIAAIVHRTSNIVHQFTLF
jgi:hypothetical protein